MDVREAWDRLCTIRELEFEAQSRSSTNTGWNGSGRGTVQVENLDHETLLFHEKGSWDADGTRELTFNNLFRWTCDPGARLIRLEHLRFGPDSPVYLFDLVPESERVLFSAQPHVCRDDLYSARMVIADEAIVLSWTVTGPRKDERIAYRYK